MFVAREYVGRESVVAVVGESDRVVDRVERHQRNDGTEGFFAHHPHGVVDLRQQCGFAPEATAFDDLAAEFESRTACEGIVDVLAYHRGLLRHDERPDVSARIVASQTHDSESREQLRTQRIEDAAIDVDALQRLTGLARREYRGTQHRGCSPLEIGVRRDDHGILAAEFQECGNEAPCRMFGHQASGAHAAGEHDGIGMIDEIGARAARAAHDAGNGGDLRHLGKDFGEWRGMARRYFARLENHTAAGEQCRDGVDHRQHHRKVPRRDHADDGIRDALAAPKDSGDRRGAPVLAGQHLRCMRETQRDHALNGAQFDVRDAFASGVDHQRGPQRRASVREDFAKTADGLRATLYAERGPGGLRRAHGRAGCRDLGTRTHRELVVDEPRERVADGQGVDAHGSDAHGRPPGCHPSLHGTNRRYHCAQVGPPRVACL